jgi:hypothetical protein
LALAGGHHVIALERQLANEPTIVRERMADLTLPAKQGFSHRQPADHRQLDALAMHLNRIRMIFVRPLSAWQLSRTTLSS